MVYQDSLLNIWEEVTKITIRDQFTVITELKMTEWKTTVHISASSQSSIAAQQNIVLADGSLCSRQQRAYL